MGASARRAVAGMAPLGGRGTSWERMGADGSKLERGEGWERIRPGRASWVGECPVGSLGFYVGERMGERVL